MRMCIHCLLAVFAISVLFFSLTATGEKPIPSDTPVQPEEPADHAALIAISSSHHAELQSAELELREKIERVHPDNLPRIRAATIHLPEHEQNTVIEIAQRCLKSSPVDWKGAAIAFEILAHTQPGKYSEKLATNLFETPPCLSDWMYWSAIESGVRVLILCDTKSSRTTLFKAATLSEQDPQKRRFFRISEEERIAELRVLSIIMDTYNWIGPLDAIVPFMERLKKVHRENKRAKELVDDGLLRAEHVSMGDFDWTNIVGDPP